MYLLFPQNCKTGICYIYIVLGYLAKTLQEAKVKIINQSICNKLYDDLITSRMLCAGNLNGGIDACQVKVKTVGKLPLCISFVYQDCLVLMQ